VKKTQKNNMTCDMITLYEFHQYIFNNHNILGFWSAKHLASQSISYEYGLIIFIKMFNWMNFFHIESNMMPLIQTNTILKDFESHKLRYIMKYDFLNKDLFIWIINLTSHFKNVNFSYNYLQLIKSRNLKKLFSLAI